jgi:hypothetical protein
MINFSRACVEMGAKYGAHVDLKSMLPCSNTLSNNVDTIANQLVDAISKEMQNVERFAATTDLWTEDYRKISYISLTVHYILNDVLFERILAVQQFKYQHTGAQILKSLKKIFLSFGIFDISEHQFVTDRGSNVIKGLEDYNRLNCTDHLYNTILEHGTTRTPEIKDLVEKASKLVRYSKKSDGVMASLKTTLKSTVPTRWNTHYDMLESIRKNFAQIQTTLADKNQTSRLSGIDINVLTQVCSFLQQFKEASLHLEATKVPTLYLVLPYYNKLLKLCQKTTVDCSELISYKQNVLNLMIFYMNDMIKIQHKAATFLYPLSKSLKVLTDTEKLEVYNFIKSIVRFHEPIIDNENDSVETSPVNHSLFADFRDEDSGSANTTDSTIFEDFGETQADSIDMEIQEYTNLKIIDKSLDLLSWWKDHKTKFPYLYQAHVFINSIPASSAASERAFSLAGNIVTEKRTRLDPEKLNSMVLSRSNLQYHPNLMEEIN